MARHYAPTKKKKLTLKLPEMPTLRISALPKLFSREKRSYAPRRFVRSFSMGDMLLLMAATLLFIAALLFAFPALVKGLLFAFSALLAAAPMLLGQLQRILARKMPDEDLLVILAAILAFCIGEGMGGAIALILYRLLQILEAYTQEKGDAAFDLLRDKLPEKAGLLIDGEVRQLMPEAVEPGQIIRVEPGEIVPLDGKIVSGVTELDQSALTGNSNGRRCGVGDEVFSGSLNCGSVIDIEVTRAFSDGAIASLIQDVEESGKYETSPERMSNRFSVWCAPCLAALALLIILIPSLITGNWVRNLRTGVIFLLLSSPSSLAISISVSCLGAELSGVFHGILSKGHDCFEVLARTKTMVFGKTGTITEGRFEICDVYANGMAREELVSVAAAAESFSNHPIAQLLKAAANWTPDMAENVMEVEEIPGRGVSAFLEGRHVYVGNAALLREHGIPFQVPSRAGAAIHVAVENRYWGYIQISDKAREGSFDSLEALRSQGVDQLVMLTGDVLSASRPLASSLGFDLMRTELSPEDKVSAIEYLISGSGQGCSVGFVGDGINDAPMLRAADVGIAIDALHAWSEAETADILLLDSRIESLPAAMRISRALRLLLWENLGFIAGTKLLILILGLSGVLSIPLAAALSTFCGIIALLNSLRAFGLE